MLATSPPPPRVLRLVRRPTPCPKAFVDPTPVKLPAAQLVAACGRRVEGQPLVQIYARAAAPRFLRLVGSALGFLDGIELPFELGTLDRILLRMLRSTQIAFACGEIGGQLMFALRCEGQRVALVLEHLSTRCRNSASSRAVFCSRALNSRRRSSKLARASVATASSRSARARACSSSRT